MRADVAAAALVIYDFSRTIELFPGYDAVRKESLRPRNILRTEQRSKTNAMDKMISTLSSTAFFFQRFRFPFPA